MAIRPIETDYAGHLFRSRLEADYAATFTHLGITWEYEPEGFTLADGTNYLPDFWLPHLNTWVEVKGAHWRRVDKVERFARDLWDNLDGDEHGEKSPENPKLPLCILASLRRDGICTPLDRTVSLVGVRSPGSHYSVILTKCINCAGVNILPIGAETCRSCGVVESTHSWWRGHYGERYESDLPLQPLIKAPVKRWEARR